MNIVFAMCVYIYIYVNSYNNLCYRQLRIKKIIIINKAKTEERIPKWNKKKVLCLTIRFWFESSAK